MKNYDSRNNRMHMHKEVHGRLDVQHTYGYSTDVQGSPWLAQQCNFHVPCSLKTFMDAASVDWGEGEADKKTFYKSIGECVR